MKLENSKVLLVERGIEIQQKSFRTDSFLLDESENRGNRSKIRGKAVSWIERYSNTSEDENIY